MTSLTYSIGEDLPNLFFNDLELLLLPEKAIYCKTNKTFFIADPHFGKAAHFRKAGIPVPEMLHWEDLMIIKQLIKRFETEHVFFLGDLFHSVINDSWDYFLNFTTQFDGVQFHLIRGNHDSHLPILSPVSALNIHSDSLHWNGLWLSHEPSTNTPEGSLNLCGHLHPGISLKSQLGQNVRLPCYYWNQKSLILPAFGKFTGLFIPEKKKQDIAFVIADKKVIPFNLL
jgi:uncharacterized protein